MADLRCKPDIANCERPSERDDVYSLNTQNFPVILTEDNERKAKIGQEDVFVAVRSFCSTNNCYKPGKKVPFGAIRGMTYMHEVNRSLRSVISYTENGKVYYGFKKGDFEYIKMILDNYYESLSSDDPRERKYAIRRLRALYMEFNKTYDFGITPGRRIKFEGAEVDRSMSGKAKAIAFTFSIKGVKEPVSLVIKKTGYIRREFEAKEKMVADKK